MFNWRRKDEWWQLLRYYQAGLVNIAFGYALFAALVWLGLQVFVAQAVGHFVGVIFNYFTYSRLAFSGQTSSKVNFVVSYVGNYFLSLAGLWIIIKFIPSPYLAGAVTTVAVSLVNFFVLKYLVFRPDTVG